MTEAEGPELQQVRQRQDCLTPCAECRSEGWTCVKDAFFHVKVLSFETAQIMRKRKT